MLGIHWGARGHGLCHLEAHSLVTAWPFSLGRSFFLSFSQFEYSKAIQQRNPVVTFSLFPGQHHVWTPKFHRFFPYKLPLNIRFPLHGSGVHAPALMPSHSTIFSLVSLFLFQSIGQPASRQILLNHHAVNVQNPCSCGLDGPLSKTKDGSLFLAGSCHQ